jgi:uncharacterized protein (DUF342 family)
MPKGKQPGKPRVSFAKPATSKEAAANCLKVLSPLSGYIDIGLQKRICADLGRHLDQTAACEEFLQTLRDTVVRLQKRSRGKPDPALLTEINDTIMEVYRSMMQNFPSR